jgi:hypothetical protein
MAELAGTWAYRSFNPTLVTGKLTPEEDALIVGALDLTLDRGVDAFYLVGTIGWRDPPPGGVLNVSGTIDESAGPEHQRFNLTAFGRQDTATDGWEYEYHGHMGRNWAMPDGSRVDRHPTLVGSVIRVRPHGDRKAGEVFSFIAVKPQQLDRETTYDLTGSWTYRSFHNNTKYPYLKAPPTARGLILQEAVLKLETKLETVPAGRDPHAPSPSHTKTTLRGTIEWSGQVLDIKGEVFPNPLERGQPQEFMFSATGAGWEYLFHGDMTRTWPNGDKQALSV